MRRLLRKMRSVGNRMTGSGAVLNARHELDRFESSIDEVETQLRRAVTTSPPRAA